MAETELIEERMKSIRDELEEIKDLQLVSKLDIINLKNEIDQLKFTVLSLPPDADKKINELVDLSNKIENIKNLKAILDDINNLKSRIQKMEESLGSAYKKVVKCKKCGYSLVSSAKFCGKCGQET